jgi:hypothetical protein
LTKTKKFAQISYCKAWNADIYSLDRYESNFCPIAVCRAWYFVPSKQNSAVSVFARKFAP